MILRWRVMMLQGDKQTMRARTITASDSAILRSAFIGDLSFADRFRNASLMERCQQMKTLIVDLR